MQKHLHPRYFYVINTFNIPHLDDKINVRYGDVLMEIHDAGVMNNGIYVNKAGNRTFIKVNISLEFIEENPKIFREFNFDEVILNIKR